MQHEMAIAWQSSFLQCRGCQMHQEKARDEGHAQRDRLARCKSYEVGCCWWTPERAWLVMEASRPVLTISSNSSMLYAMPPPVPPSVNAGRMISGKLPIISDTCDRMVRPR